MTPFILNYFRYKYKAISLLQDRSLLFLNLWMIHSVSYYNQKHYIEIPGLKFNFFIVELILR